MKRKKTIKISHGISNKVGLHPYYQDLINQLPDSVIAVKEKKTQEAYWKKQGEKDVLNRFTGVLKWLVNFVGLPNIWPVKTEADILYCCQHLPITRKKWILDIDHPFALVRYSHKNQHSILAKAITRWRISSTNCKAIIFWSQAAKKAFISAFGTPSQSVLNKMHVVYPSLEFKDVKRVPRKKLRVLFISNLVGQKGGFDLLEAFSRFHEKNKESELIFIAPASEKLKREYSRKGVVFKERMPREMIFEEFRKADVFAYPTKMDIFGLVLLEALSFGLPVLTTKDFATPELVDHLKTGILLKRSCPSWFGSDGLAAMNCDFHSEDYQQLIHTSDPLLQEDIIGWLEKFKSADVRKKVGYTKATWKFSPMKRRAKLEEVFSDF